MKYVFNTEGKNETLGRFYRVEEDTVEYEVAGGAVKRAPADCVMVRELARNEIVAEFERLAGHVTRAALWVGGDTTVALNSLLATGVEMIEYAKLMGAALSEDTARQDLRRRVESGDYYLVERAHSRALEEARV
jgi:hypothetical protein